MTVVVRSRSLKAAMNAALLRALAAMACLPLFVHTSTLRAQGTIWHQSSGPQGGLITSLAVDSIRRVFISTAAGGIFVSLDHGATWRPRNLGLGSINVKMIQASPRKYLYAVTFNKGMYRYSENDQFAWDRLYADSAFAIPNTLAVNAKGFVYVGSALTGVQRSTDDGASFIRLTNGLDSADRNVRLITVGQNDRLLLATAAPHIYHSTDDGEHWTAMTVPKGLGIINVMAEHDDFAVVGDDQGQIFRTTDAGASWQQTYQHPEKAGIYSLAKSPANNHFFLWNMEGYCERSSDNGSSWQQVDSIATGGDFFPMIIDPSGDIYVGTDFEGAKESTDDGENFFSINNGLNANLNTNIAENFKGDLFALSEVFVFRSRDKGHNWDQLGVDLGDNFYEIPMTIDNLNNVYVGVTEGLLQSKNDGESWSFLFEPEPPIQSFTVSGLYAFPPGSEFSTIFAGTERGLLFSNDYGRTFEHMAGELGDDFVTHITMGRDGVLYASGATGKLYRSETHGRTFDKLGTATGIRAVSRERVMFSISNRQLLRSDDTAKSWKQLFPQEPSKLRPQAMVFSVMIDSAERLIATTDSGIYLSNDNGDNWIGINSGLHDASSPRLAAVSKVIQGRDGRYYAATRGMGVMWSSPEFSGVEPVPGPRSFQRPLTQSAAGTDLSVASLNQNFPNPFKPATSIHFQLYKEATVSLVIRDVLGRSVRTLLDNDSKASGSYQVMIDLTGMPAGTYTCELSASGQTLRRKMQLQN